MAGSVNTHFQDDNLNDNGVPYVSVLLNISVDSFDDPQLISNAISNGNGSNRSYQQIGIDASPNRSDKELYGFNYFFRSQLNTTTGIPGDRRRVVILNGSTGEVLLNESASGNASQASRIIASINSVTAAPEESFTSWIADSGVPAASQGENDDPDGDGLTNLLEYALGTNPARSDHSEGLRIESPGGSPVLVFQRSKTAAVTSLVIETAGDSGEFSPYTPPAADVLVDDQGDTELLSVRLSGLSDKLLIRLRTATQ